MRDFFVSFNRADLTRAEWIARTLEANRYSVYFQPWDFRPGGNFVLLMNEAMSESKRTLAVLSKNYLSSLFTQPEWSAAFASDPTGQQRKLVPVRIESVALPPLLSQIIYVDLVDLPDPEAERVLLDGLEPDGRKALSVRTASPKQAAADLREIFDTSWPTFVAQVHLRDQLRAMIEKRLGVRERLEHEAFFDKYFPVMDEHELRLHRTIRAYTEGVLSEYNTRALGLMNANPGLRDALPSFQKLKLHLLAWMNKYNAIFRTTPSMCLCYVGVEEKLPFPREINGELAAYLGQ